MRAKILLIILVCVPSAFAEPFQNLGFDEANTNNMEAADPFFGEGIGTSKDLLLGWEL
ncbi:MAG: hypothetical protein M1608_12025 [Candidatus Omnitrophica bacterium]|nr:hypothetical protein [Candidatus Omnitrophota bacterium]